MGEQGSQTVMQLITDNKANGMLGFWRQHRSVLAWDLARAIWLCRWGALVGFLSDDEAWQQIITYSSPAA